MKKPSCPDEMTIRHQFDCLCQMALKGEAVNYYKHMAFLNDHEVMFSELSEAEQQQMTHFDTYDEENIHFPVLGYDIEVKDMLLAV
ncbi:MAG: hypothetical protein LUF27_16660 [Lachnospiraceae bacterium]|nr:hypothetical protein [Lachnospiraceae bacterium]